MPRFCHYVIRRPFSLPKCYDTHLRQQNMSIKYILGLAAASGGWMTSKRTLQGPSLSSSSGSWSVCLLAIQPPDAAASKRTYFIEFSRHKIFKLCNKTFVPHLGHSNSTEYTSSPKRKEILHNQDPHTCINIHVFLVYLYTWRINIREVRQNTHDSRVLSWKYMKMHFHVTFTMHYAHMFL